jgi:hypothetical protein
MMVYDTLREGYLGNTSLTTLIELIHTVDKV